MLDLSVEEAYANAGFSCICGLDEAGRGPLAGPVVAGACILPGDWQCEALNDSKKLSEKKREALYDYITTHALAWAVGMASPQEIDEINILNASMLAMKRAAEALPKTPDLLLVDGNIVRGFTQKAIPFVKGDALVASIAAASILAKVTRDRLCVEMEANYPGYGFLKHKGYPTKEHREAVLRLGPCPIHRRSFLKFYDHR